MIDFPFDVGRLRTDDDELLSHADKSADLFVICFLIFLNVSFSRFSLFLAVSSVPGRFKQLREACGKIVRLFSSQIRGRGAEL